MNRIRTAVLQRALVEEEGAVKPEEQPPPNMCVVVEERKQREVVLRLRLDHFLLLFGLLPTRRILAPPTPASNASSLVTTRTDVLQQEHPLDLRQTRTHLAVVPAQGANFLLVTTVAPRTTCLTNAQMRCDRGLKRLY